MMPHQSNLHLPRARKRAPALWKRLSGYKVWTDRDMWSPELRAWEYIPKVRGLTLVAHHRFDVQSSMWFVSEKSTGLRITPNLHDNRKEALKAACRILERYTDDDLRTTVESNIIKQVVHQIQGEKK